MLLLPQTEEHFNTAKKSQGSDLVDRQEAKTGIMFPAEEHRSLKFYATLPTKEWIVIPDKVYLTLNVNGSCGVSLSANNLSPEYRFRTL